MFQFVVDSFINLFSLFMPESWRQSTKRSREESDLSDCDEETLPYKKLRMNSNFENKGWKSKYFPSSTKHQSTANSSSQTNDIIDLDEPEYTTISLVDDEYPKTNQITEVIDLNDSLDESKSGFNKENFLFKVNKISPGKKGKYSAPGHCRSPFKNKFKHVSYRRTSDDVQYVGTLQSPSFPSSSDIFSSNKSTRQVMRKIIPSRTPYSPRTHKIMNMSQASPFSFKQSVVYDLNSRRKYGELLSKVLKSPELFSCAPSSVTRINNSHYRLGNIEDGVSNKSVIKSESVSAYVDLTKDTTEQINAQEVINLDDNEFSEIKPSTHRRLVSPVNSLSNKIKHMPCTSTNFLSSLSADIERFKAEFIQDRDQISKELSALSPLRKPFEKALEERLQRHLKITCIDLVEDEEDEEPVKPQLTDDMMSQIINAWDPKKPKNQVLVSKFNYELKRADLLTLSGLNWLNDEVINFYMELLMSRGKEDGFPSVHAFSTFFYPKLEKDGYSSLRRWTRKVDIFSQDLVVVPVHLRVHWCLSVIDMKLKTITYFDSMGQSNNVCVNSLLKYLQDEHLDKKKDLFDTKDWKLICTTDSVPQQMNSCDCGVFACTFAEYTTRQAKYNFSQDDMPYFRRKITYEILQSKLLPWK